MAGINKSNPGNIPQSRSAQGFKLVGFPREFERSFWDVFDKRYYTILIITWIILYSFTYYMSTREWKIPEQVREKIRQTYMRQLYAEFVTPVKPTISEGEGAGLLTEEEGGKEVPELSETGKQLVSESVSERVQRRRAGVGARRAKRHQMEQEAAGYGVLAALTAAGGAGTGTTPYADILGEAGGVSTGLADAGQLVSGAAALEAATRSGQRSRIAKRGGFGSEVGETNIDDLVDGTGVSGGTSVVRRGNIKLAQDTKVSGTGSGASQRNPEVIDAIINQNKASVEYCYQSQLKIDPNLRGEILLNFDILPSGKVGNVKIVRSTLKNPKVEKCIIRSVRRWIFPQLKNARGMVTIRTKFVFG